MVDTDNNIERSYRLTERQPGRGRRREASIKTIVKLEI